MYFVVLGVIQIIYLYVPPWNDLLDWTWYFLNLFQVILWSFVSIFTIIYRYSLISHYNKYPADNSCDFCGNNVQLKGLVNILGYKVVLCKKCYRRHITYFIIILESLMALYLILLINTIPFPYNINNVPIFYFILSLGAIIFPVFLIIYYIYLYRGI